VQERSQVLLKGLASFLSDVSGSCVPKCVCWVEFFWLYFVPLKRVKMKSDIEPHPPQKIRQIRKEAVLCDKSLNSERQE